MFTRQVIMKIKLGSAAELARVIETEVAPLLCRQEGMRLEETFINPGLSEAVSNSYWDTEGYASAYSRAGYPGALEALSSLIEGAPRVETFHISSSTFHGVTAHRREAYRASKLRQGAGASAPLARPRGRRPGGAALIIS